ncbi:MAG: FGGY family carbohydrate kinase, partial [Oscillospiraceae bacterium]
MKRKYHIAFDLGAESGRAVVGELVDGQMQMQEILRFKTGTVKLGEQVYCSAVASYQGIIEALKKFSIEFGAEPESLGVDSWGCDFALLDSKNRLLGLPYSYRDKRVNNTENIIEQKMGAEHLYDLTGIQMLPINTLNQLLGMMRAGDETLQLADNMLFIGDLMHFFLTGRIATEYTMLTISQLYNTAKKRYENEVFDCFGISKKIQTEIIYAGSLYGMLKQEICDKTGIKSAKVITPAVHDTASGFAAIPAKKGETWYAISSGTWSILGTEEDRVLITDDTRRFSLSNSGGVFGRNLLLKNVMGLWIIQQCKQEWNRTDASIDYNKIVELASAAEPFYAMIDPDSLDFFNPKDMCKAIIDYLKKTNQRQTNDIGQMAR